MWRLGVAQIDPELAGNGTVDRAGSAIGAGRAGFLLGRKSADFEIATDLGVEHRRQLGANQPQPFLDEGEDFGPALVAFGEVIARVAAERLHPASD